MKYIAVITDNLSPINLIKKEVRGIARKCAPINIVVHYPKTEEGKRELERRVAEVHADMVTQYLNKLNCPSQQKLQLLDAVIAATN